MTFTKSLDEIRLEARQATYPNSEAERQAVFENEQRVYQAVALHEDNLVNLAEATLNSAEPVFIRTDALVNDLWDLRGELENGANASPQVAARFETLRKAAEAEIRALNAVERAANFQAEKVSDPYGSLDALRKKYPAIANVGGL